MIILCISVAKSNQLLSGSLKPHQILMVENQVQLLLQFSLKFEKPPREFGGNLILNSGKSGT